MDCYDRFYSRAEMTGAAAAAVCNEKEAAETKGEERGEGRRVEFQMRGA